jgi:starch phosphorylase
MGNLKYTNGPSDATAEDSLAQLALDVGGTASQTAAAVWGQLNPELWERTHSPWAVLQTVSGERLGKITSDPAFRANLEDLLRARSAENEVPRWFQQAHANSPLTCAAYFSMEYMLSEALPIYSGGLGNVAGDQLKAASDLSVPVIGVGLLYSQGYFRQEIDRSGAQRALYPFNDPGQLPIKPVREADGDWLRIPIPFPGFELWIRAWEVQVGRAKLFLLDTNDPANIPEYRGITSELYGGGNDLRLRQEHILGIGGWRLLRALGIVPEVCHLNEGHAAFAVLERAASYMEDNQVDFWVALTATRAGNLFTTHTPVEAGFDRFPVDLMRPHFENYCATRLKISFDELMALGRRDPGDGGEPFNMAYLAMRGSSAVNGVSRLHGAVSRTLFGPLFPRWPAEEVPIGHITNGVHVPTWHSPEAQSLWSEVCGQTCWHSNPAHIGGSIRATGDAPIWNMRNAARKSLIGYIRNRYARQVAIQLGSPHEIAAASAAFNFDTLTLGFARRFATYKRPNLLLRDPDRLLRLLRDPRRPVQLVLAGKAHPEDGAGQDMIRQWSEFIRRSGAQESIIFLSDYDMLLTEELAGGVDVWINTPRRPWEASGTSGMKLLVNGGLNLSELDGWWAEAYAPEVGWAIGDGREHGDDPAADAADAASLYALLEQRIVPEFYQRNEAGIPAQWVAKIRESMARLTPEYSANRAVREYTESHYVPAAAAFAARAKDRGKLAAEMLAWQRKIDSEWNGIAFGRLEVESLGGRLHFRVPVRLGGLEPSAVRVELYAQGIGGDDPVRIQMDAGASLPGSAFLYSANVDGTRKPSDYTPRIVPYHPMASVPLESHHILWQK